MQGPPHRIDRQRPDAAAHATSASLTGARTLLTDQDARRWRRCMCSHQSRTVPGDLPDFTRRARFVNRRMQLLRTMHQRRQSADALPATPWLTGALHPAESEEKKDTDDHGEECCCEAEHDARVEHRVDHWWTVGKSHMAEPAPASHVLAPTGRLREQPVC